MAAKDPYDVLGVKRTATADEIRRAYRSLARKYHPDVNKESDAAARFAEVQEAYDLLSDEERRREYDQFGFGTQRGPARGPRWQGVGQGAGQVSEADFASIFDEFFGGGQGPPFGGVRAGPRAQPRPRPGPNVEQPVKISFMTAALGGTERLRMARNGEAETIEVRIPSGIESGTKLRVRGKGGAGGSGGPAGDVILTVEVGEHPLFRRDGLDLLVVVPVNVAEAALGTTVTVPLLKGSVEMKVPPGSSSGRKLRVKGRGITDARGETGDLYAVVQIVVPENLSPKARELFRGLSGELQNPRETGPWAD